MLEALFCTGSQFASMATVWGDRRVREGAGETIRVLTGEETIDEPTQPPVEVPPPVPGGSEPVTREDGQPAERR
jgi:hypothetical protein